MVAAQSAEKKGNGEDEELSEDDKELEERIGLCVQRTGDSDANVVANALQMLVNEISSSTRCALLFP
jgi:hypothetical protein